MATFLVMRKFKDHIPITDTMHKTLISHRSRTGAGAITVYKHMQEQGLLPDNHNITIKRIESWFTRIAKATDERDFQTVVTAYESITNAQDLKRTPRRGQERVTLEPEFVLELNEAFQERPNFSRAMLLRRSNPPDGLTAAKLSMILQGKVKTIPLSHKTYLERVLASLS